MDQIVLGTALVAALGSFAWFGRAAEGSRRSHRAFVTGAKLSATAEVPAGFLAPVGMTEKWPPPAAQARGREWVYDVFTPPEIYYDAPTRQFAVIPPDDPAGANIVTTPGLELVAVKRAPFRLQLVGYVGGEGRYLGAFENLRTTEVFLAGPGRPVPALDLVITDFTVRRRPVPIADSMTSNQWVATAIVRDERTGGSTTLTPGECCYTDELRAVLAEAEDEDETIRELRQGEEFRSSEHTYKIKGLQLEPPTAELIQTSAGAPQPVRVSLTPRMPRGLPFAKSAN